MTSPNYPGDYPNHLDRTEMILVEEGLILSLQFTAFDIVPHPTCDFDHLKIVDGDGTLLMEKSCGSTDSGTVVTGSQSISSSLPARITSRSNIVNIIFSTNDWNDYRGWSLSWSAVTPGECQQHRHDVSDFRRCKISTKYTHLPEDCIRSQIWYYKFCFDEADQAICSEGFQQLRCLLIGLIAVATFVNSLYMCTTCLLRSSSNPRIFDQSAALLPLAALAKTWKPKTANLNSVTTAAAASAHLGSALPVSLTQPLELDSGNGSFHFAPQKAVAAKVSDLSTK